MKIGKFETDNLDEMMARLKGVAENIGFAEAGSAKVTDVDSAEPIDPRHEYEIRASYIEFESKTRYLNGFLVKKGGKLKRDCLSKLQHFFFDKNTYQACCEAWPWYIENIERIRAQVWTRKSTGRAFYLSDEEWKRIDFLFSAMFCAKCRAGAYRRFVCFNKDCPEQQMRDLRKLDMKKGQAALQG